MIPSDKALRLVHSPGAADRGGRPPRWQVEVHVADLRLASTLWAIARSSLPGTGATGSGVAGSSHAHTADAPPWDGSSAAGPTARWGTVLITDTTPTVAQGGGQHGGAGTATVLVVGPTPYDARWALQTMSTVPVHGMVLAERPAGLAEVLASLAADVVRVPVSIVEAARSAPALTDEQQRLASYLVAGCSNPEMCAALGISQSGVKRRLSTLFELLEVDNRVQAAALAARLGIRAARR